MYLLCAILEECGHVVAQLRSPDYGVVAEHHSLVLEDGMVGNELHLCHQIASGLVSRSEASWPCRRILEHSPLVWYLVSLGISQRRAHSRVWNAAHQVCLGIILLSHLLSATLSDILNVDALVVACWEAIVYPQEGAYLLLMVRFLEHLYALSRNPHNLARSKVPDTSVAQIGEARCLA